MNLLDLNYVFVARRSSEYFVVLDLLCFAVENLELEVVVENLELEAVENLELEVAVELKADFAALVEPVPLQGVLAEQGFDFEVPDIADSMVTALETVVAVVEEFDHVAEELQSVAAVDTVDDFGLGIVDEAYFDLDLLGEELIQEQLVLAHIVMETKRYQ